MNNKKDIDDYFDDNFEVTYTGDLPPIQVDHDDYDDEPYDRHKQSDRSNHKNPRKSSHSSSSEELATPIRNIVRTGSTAAEKLTNFFLRPAPVLMSGIITVITGFSFWNQMSDYGDIKTLSSSPFSAGYPVFGSIM